MTSLSEVYEPDAEFQTSLRRLYAGVGLFLLGAVLVVAGILAATTHLFVGPGGSLVEMRELGGTLAGLGAPAVFTGILTVLPASRRTRGAAVIGAAVAVLGVALFVHAYPCQWSGSNCGQGLANLTLPVTVTYFLGTMTTFWCLFVGVANFKARNNPGGTAQVEVTAQGETRVIEVPKSELRKFGGSLGVLGGTPEPEAETQTNRPGVMSGTVSDGGSSTAQVREVADEGAVVERTSTPSSPSGSGGPSGSSGGSSGSSGGSSGSSGGSSGSPSRVPEGDGGVDVFRAGSSAATATDSGSADSGSTGPGSRGGGGGAAATQTTRTTSQTGTARSSTGAGGSTPGPTGGTSGSAGTRSTGSARKSGDWSPTGGAGTTGQQGGADRDRYCGSCTHFRYVRTERGMQPYCGAHSEVMDDMEACDEWTGRNGN